MGACGCGDFNGRWRIPGPDGKWYVIGPYSGCNNGCDNPAGLLFDLMDEKELKMWDAEDLPIVGGPSHPNFGIPLAHPSQLSKAIFERLDQCGVCVGEDEDDRELAIDEFGTQGVLATAMQKAVEKYDADIRKNKTD